jgi:ATP-dependent RNA helicase RhlE
VRILVATDIAARGLDIDQCHTWSTSSCRTSTKTTCTVSAVLAVPVVRVKHRWWRRTKKLLKSIERMTKQKIADGDLMGFDSSAVEPRSLKCASVRCA